MGPSAHQWRMIQRRIETWGAALKRGAAEHGVPNSFGVIELAGEYRGLDVKEGYYLGKTRCFELTEFTGYAVSYERGRFVLSERVPDIFDTLPERRDPYVVINGQLVKR